MSFDILQEKIDSMQSPVVVGLDPMPDYIPEHIMHRRIAEQGETLRAAADAYLEFNCGLIDALCDIVPAVKPQSAYYELLGHHGVWTLKKTCDYARSKGMYVIADVKRGDIGSTAEAYSEAYLGEVKIGGSIIAPFNFDAVTVNAYLGSDGIQPFLDTCLRKDKAIFVLVRTSNASARELQDMDTGREKLYIAVGELIERLAAGTEGKYGYSRIGAVAGATYPEDMKLLRFRFPNMFFLVPGYGAQGGSARDAAAAFDSQGRGAVVNSSRAIICAWKKTGMNRADYAEAARAEAINMRDALRREIHK